jgi:hypothetical protein
MGARRVEWLTGSRRRPQDRLQKSRSDAPAFLAECEKGRGIFVAVYGRVASQLRTAAWSAMRWSE